MKKLFSIIIAVAITALVSVSVFAADTENYFCDFSAENTDYKCYQPGEGNGFIADGKLTMAVWYPTMVNLDNHIFGDAVYEFDLTVGTDKDWAGVMFCKTNPSDIWDHSGYMFYVRTDGTFDFFVAGTGVVATGAIEGSVEEEQHYKIVKEGESIKIYCGDSETPIVDVTDALYSEGYFSFVASSAGTNAHTTLDNLSIKLPENEENVTPDDTDESEENAPQTGFATVMLCVTAILSAGYAVTKKH